MTNKERAELLFHKYTKEYNRFVVSGYIKQVNTNVSITYLTINKMCNRLFLLKIKS
jgi:radical SAM superfamily enzyme with C-terminal helix-hairpin-helix motif